jgi:hypothetical protein
MNIPENWKIVKNGQTYSLKREYDKFLVELDDQYFSIFEKGSNKLIIKYDVADILSLSKLLSADLIDEISTANENFHSIIVNNKAINEEIDEEGYEFPEEGSGVALVKASDVFAKGSAMDGKVGIMWHLNGNPIYKWFYDTEERSAYIENNNLKILR